jgi:hydroxypyruvate isomerase
MKKSLCIETFFRKIEFYERFKLSKKFGFDCIEFWSWKDKDLLKIRNLCDKYDLQITSFSADPEFCMVGDSEKDCYWNEVCGAVEAAKMVNCSSIVVHSNAEESDGTIQRKFEHLSELTRHLNMYDALKKLAKLGSENNINFTLEAVNTLHDHPGNFLISTKVAYDLVSQVNSPNVNILFDAYHMHIMESDIANTFRKYKEKISYIHIADAPGRGEPGTGEINYSHFFKTLWEENFTGTVGFELFPIGDEELVCKDLLLL